MLRFLIGILSCLLFPLHAFNQTYAYADHEINCDRSKEQVQLMVGADSFIHVWRWGTNGVAMDVYNADLHHLFSKNLSRRPGSLRFIPFNGFYYAILLEAVYSKLFYIGKAGSCIEKTTALSDEIPVRQLPYYYIQESDSNLFFIQQSKADSTAQTLLHITAVDSNLQYTNSLNLGIKDKAGRLLRRNLYPLGNQLLLLNTTINDNATHLSVNKLNVTYGHLLSRSFQFENEMFIPDQLLPYGNDFILQSQVSEPRTTDNWPAAYTNFIKLDSSLNIMNEAYIDAESTRKMTTPEYTDVPVLTVVLPDKHLLTVHYRRSRDRKVRIDKAQLRFTWLDSGLNVVKMVNQPTINYSYFPTFLLTRDKQIQIYYEEEIKSNLTAIHTYQLRDSIDNDRILQLIPKNHYELRKAIRTTADAFVMPYTRNYKLGIVRVKVPEEWGD